jgi:pyrroloquinoline-quinone synthase
MMQRIEVPDRGWDCLLKPEWLNSLRATSFLSRCRTGIVSRRELELFLKQHHHYSQHFTRYLCALISNLPNEDDRQLLTKNLFDEMGLFTGVSHAEIYRRMILTILPSGNDVGVFPATQALIETMLECCRNPRPMVGLGALCLGAEAVVPEVYSTILDGFDAVREPRENLHFFTIHVSDDDEHARTMRNIILRELSNNPRSRHDLEYGAARAFDARVEFFEAISEAASD